jgi:glycosyltransferase involved in cell wall biosynthesis
MATAIMRMLSDDAMADRMGQAARHRIAEMFSVTRMVRATEDIYLELLDRKQRKRLPSAAC